MFRLGKRIEEVRIERGMSRAALAERLGVTTQTVYNIERACEYNLTTDMMKRLEKALRVRFKISIVEEAMANATVVLGSDEMILHIRKTESRPSMDNDQLGALIASWIRNRKGVLLKKDADSLWGKEGDFVGADRLPMTSAQWELPRALLPDLFTYLESLCR